MNYAAVIGRDNDVFYREAQRAKNIEEINESAGLKHLLDKEIKHLKEYAYQEIMNKLEVRIEKDYSGYILTLKEKR